MKERKRKKTKIGKKKGIRKKQRKRKKKEKKACLYPTAELKNFFKVICRSIKHQPTQQLIKSGISDKIFTASG